ncbi:PHP domain-containing protein [Phycicoccus sp. Soil803]|uniref:PHP domain-containing protein n=1 Tax=Phycicoccus sp. Soil803 TaxID=1736415 RepID=UPI000709667F|nr:PHP domain-containing protein [Phycicoccus sp. Soil803]KRF25763.1 metal-dependent phosphoesterase [Phycicoccus sp. Soil803]
MPIDLHTHSTASDGTEPSEVVVAQAARAGLDVVALTDHDTYAGWPAAVAAAGELGVDLVRGVEVSCSQRGISVHLLAYLVDPEASGLLHELDRARDSRVTRIDRMVELMAADGIPVTIEEVRAQAGVGTTMGRPHIADALVASGFVMSRDEAFADVLRNGSRYYVSHYAPDPVRAVELVRAAGGVPVMAHPFANGRGWTVEDSVIERMADAGLAGLEAHHRDHTPAERTHAVELAARLGLFVTGSSDYHGAGKENRLGENTTTPEVLAQIEEQATSGIDVVRVARA